ncbi:MAG: hypothetical protein AAF483_28070, partial [Planctomycetota bacterium]
MKSLLQSLNVRAKKRFRNTHGVNRRRKNINRLATLEQLEARQLLAAAELLAAPESAAEVAEQRSRTNSGTYEKIADVDLVGSSLSPRVIGYHFNANQAYRIQVRMTDGPLAPNDSPPNFGRIVVLENGRRVKVFEGWGELTRSYSSSFQ